MVTCSNLKIKAYGKINLALDIVGKRDDGYHMLNTVMQSVSCFDLLDFTLSEGEGHRSLPANLTAFQRARIISSQKPTMPLPTSPILTSAVK